MKIGKSLSAFLAASVCVFSFVAPVRAADADGLDQIITRACKVPASQPSWQNYPILPDGEFEWVAINSSRVFFFASAQVGEITSDNKSAERISDAFRVVNDDKKKFTDDDPDADLQLYISTLQDNLLAGLPSNIKAYYANGEEVTTDGAQARLSLNEDGLRDSFWLAGKGIVLRCKRDKTPSSSTDQGQTTIAKNDSKIDLRLRGTTEALPLTGEERKTADAAKIALKRERVFLDDGTRKQTNNLSLKGVLGLALDANDRESLFVYGSYELDRTRTKPSAPLTPPATARDGDTEIIKLGFFGHSYIDLDPTVRQDVSLTVTLDAGYLFNLVNDSERMRAKVIASPFFDTHISGICGIRRMRTTFIPGVLGRCDVDALFELNHVTKMGSLTAKKEFVLAGGRLGYSLMFASNPDGGIFAGARYELQKSLYGGVPDIERHYLYAKYRYWNGEKFAFDIGVDLVDGINPDSFADENILQLSFGILF